MTARQHVLQVHVAQPDARLVTQAQSGDSDAFTALYQRYYTPLFAYIVERIRNTADAEDICAVVFLALWQQLPTYEERGYQLSAWLYRTAHCRIVDYFRYSDRRPQVPLRDDLPGTNHIDARLLAAETALALQGGLATLTTNQRDVLALRFGADESIRSTAQRLGMPETAVKSLQHRAVASLRRYLHAHGEGATS